jgi:hypothetical protein
MFQSRSLTEQQKGVLEDLFFSTLPIRIYYNKVGYWCKADILLPVKEWCKVW